MQEDKSKKSSPKGSSTQTSKLSPAKKKAKTQQEAKEQVIKKPAEILTKKTSEKSSLKRKVTGAGMFQSSWTRGAQRDTEDYRNGYPVNLTL